MNYIKDKSNTVKKQKTNSYVFRPMLFSTPMVQAILEGRKTQTRRIMKHQPPLGNYKFVINVTGTRCKENGLLYFKSPFNIGDIIWVRETFAPIKNSNDFFYKADEGISVPFFDYQQKWKPSLFMPKEACRLFLEVKDIRIERLNEISESDAIAEGVEIIHYAEPNVPIYNNYLLKEKLGTTNPILSYQTLWQKINGQNSWKENPFVWVYDFKVVPKPSDFLNIN